jgi:hypothetical protein
MSDENQSTTTPAPSSAPAVDRVVHTGGSYHEFQDRVNQRVKALEQQSKGLNQPAPPQPPPVAKTVQPAPKQSLEQVQANAAAEAQALLDPSAPPPAEGGEQQEGQTDQPQITPEDLELLAKAKKWLESEEMPEEFYSKLVKLKNGEEFEHEPYEEAIAGRMRERDHSRAMQAIKRERDEWAQREQHFTSHFDAIFNDADNGAAGGEAMYEIYSRAGKFKQLEHLYGRMDRERQEDVDAANGMGLAIMRRMRLDPANPAHVKDHRVQEAINKEWTRRRQQRESDAHHRAVRLENERLKRETQRKQSDDQQQEYYATQRKQLEQLRPRAFEKFGLKHDDPVQRQEFDAHLNALIQQESATRVTPELVVRAARAAKEKLKEIERRRMGGGTPAGQGGQQQTFSPSLSGGGRMPGNGKPKQWHAENFAHEFKLPKW